MRRLIVVVLTLSSAIARHEADSAPPPEPRLWETVRKDLPMRVMVFGNYNLLPLMRMLEKRTGMEITLTGRLDMGDWAHTTDWTQGRSNELRQELENVLERRQLHWLDQALDCIWIWDAPKSEAVKRAIVERVSEGVDIIYSGRSRFRKETDFAADTLTRILPASSVSEMLYENRLPAKSRKLPFKRTGHPSFIGVPVEISKVGAIGKLKAPLRDGTEVLLERPGLGPVAVMARHGKGHVLLLMERNIYTLWPMWFVRGGHRYFGGFRPERIPDPYRADVELRLRFYEQASYWMRHGSQAYPAMAEVALEPIEPFLGESFTARVTVRNFAAPAAIRAVIQIIAPDRTSIFVVEKSLSLREGETESLELQILARAEWSPGNYTVYAYAVAADKPLVCHQAVNYLHLRAPLEVNVKTDRGGYPVGATARINVDWKSLKEARSKQAQLFFWVEDWRGRVRSCQERLVTSDEGEAAFKWTLDDPAPDMPTFWARVLIQEGEKRLGAGGVRIYRHRKASLRGRMVFSLWHTMGSNGGSLFDPAVIQLFRHAGFNGLGMIAGDLQIYWAERTGMSAYIEGFDGRLDLDGWGLDFSDRVKKQLQQQLTRRTGGTLNTSAIDILSHGEEPGYGGGWGRTYHWEEDTAPEEANKVFRFYLQQFYPSVGALNAEWGTDFASWDEVRLTKKHSLGRRRLTREIADRVPWNAEWSEEQRSAALQCGTTARYIVTTEFYAWYFQQLAKERRRQLDDINPTPRHVISTGDYGWLHGYGALDTPSPYQHWAYPKELMPAYLLKARRYHGDTPCFHILWGFFDDPKQLAQLVWQYTVNQASHLDFWYAFRLQFNPDLSMTKAALWMRRFSDKIRRVERAILDAHRCVSDEVAIYVPELLTPGSIGRVQVERWKDFHSVQIQPDIITLSALLESGYTPAYPLENELRRYRLVFAPFAQCIDEQRAKALREFVERGGVLVTTPGFATHDRHGKPQPIYPGAGLDDLLGVRLLARLQRPKARDVDLTNSVIPFPEGLKVRSYNWDVVEVIRPDVKVLARYDDGAPALLLRKVGKGWVVHCNFVYDWAHHWATLATPEREAYKRFINALCRFAKVGEPAVVIETPQGEGVPYWGWYPYTDATGQIQYIMLFSDWRSPKVSAKVRLRLPKAFAYDVVSGTAIELIERNGRKEFTCTLQPGDGEIIAILPYRLKRIEVAPVNGSVRAGDMLELHIRLLKEHGSLAAAAHPLHIEVHDRNGRLAPALCVQTSIVGEGTARIPTALNDEPGIYRFVVRDAATGRSGYTSVEILPPEKPPPSVVCEEAKAPRIDLSLGRAAPLDEEGFIATLRRLTELCLRTDDENPKRILSAFAFDVLAPDVNRHGLLQRLWETDWRVHVGALRRALQDGGVFILTGEDVGVDPESGVALNPFFDPHALDALQQLARNARVWELPDRPALAVQVGGGRLLLVRQSVDWTGWKIEQFKAWRDALRRFVSDTKLLQSTTPPTDAESLEGVNLREWFVSHR